MPQRLRQPLVREFLDLGHYCADCQGRLSLDPSTQDWLTMIVNSGAEPNTGVKFHCANGHKWEVIHADGHLTLARRA